MYIGTDISRQPLCSPLALMNGVWHRLTSNIQHVFLHHLPEISLLSSLSVHALLISLKLEYCNCLQTDTFKRTVKPARKQSVLHVSHTQSNSSWTLIVGVLLYDRHTRAKISPIFDEGHAIGLAYFTYELKRNRTSLGASVIEFVICYRISPILTSPMHYSCFWQISRRRVQN